MSQLVIQTWGIIKSITSSEWSFMGGGKKEEKKSLPLFIKNSLCSFFYIFLFEGSTLLVLINESTKQKLY